MVAERSYTKSKDIKSLGNGCPKYNGPSGGHIFKTAYLIDGGWLNETYKHAKKIRDWPSAKTIYSIIRSCVAPEEDIYRIFYYDALPFDGKRICPIDGEKIDFSATPAFNAKIQFFNTLSQMDFVALRRSVLKFQGWGLNGEYYRKWKKTQSAGKPPPRPTKDDVKPLLVQKGVDMCIGVDMGTLSIKRIVERIVLVSGDTDMIPAMKLARIEGTQIVLVKNSNKLKQSMLDHSDMVRYIDLEKF